ncbi:small multidrug resistance pump [Paenibacillus sp. GP183]|nr:small multidrug resistance pump [Paenibacillus sp. GP183]
MHWILLILAIIAEVAGTTIDETVTGFSKFMPSLLMFVFYGLSLSLMNFVLRGVDVSIAYAIWSAHGMALIVTIGILFYSEQMTLLNCWRHWTERRQAS